MMRWPAAAICWAVKTRFEWSGTCTRDCRFPSLSDANSDMPPPPPPPLSAQRTELRPAGRRNIDAVTALFVPGATAPPAPPAVGQTRPSTPGASSSKQNIANVERPLPVPPAQLRETAPKPPIQPRQTATALPAHPRPPLPPFDWHRSPRPQTTGCTDAVFAAATALFERQWTPCPAAAGRSRAADAG